MKSKKTPDAHTKKTNFRRAHNNIDAATKIHYGKVSAKTDALSYINKTAAPLGIPLCQAEIL